MKFREAILKQAEYKNYYVSSKMSDNIALLQRFINDVDNFSNKTYVYKKDNINMYDTLLSLNKDILEPYQFIWSKENFFSTNEKILNREWIPEQLFNPDLFFDFNLNEYKSLLNELAPSQETQKFQGTSDLYATITVAEPFPTTKVKEAIEEVIEDSHFSVKKLVQILKEYQVKNAIIFYVVSQLFLVLVLFGVNIAQRESDEHIRKEIQAFVSEEVFPFSFYTKYLVKNNIETFDEVGLSRTNTIMRMGKSKSAPAVFGGYLKEKSVVYIFETKNNWTYIETEIDGVFVQGWVQESTISPFKRDKKKKNGIDE